MPNVLIENMRGKSIDCQSKMESLLDILLKASDWMHACGGKGRCTTCKVQIVNGMENLSGLTQSEKNYLNLSRLRENERLSCQVKVNGDIVIRVPRSVRLPHLNYTG